MSVGLDGKHKENVIKGGKYQENKDMFGNCFLKQF